MAQCVLSCPKSVLFEAWVAMGTLLACTFTQVDGNALRWLRTEQIPRLPAKPLEVSLPTSLKMPKLGFWKEMEAQRPKCSQGENIFVHSILMRATWTCMGEF